MSKARVEIATLVVSPEKLGAMAFAVAETASLNGVILPRRVAEDIAYEVLRAAYSYEQVRRTKSSGHAEDGECKP